jgi:hypothetical protein
MNGLSIVFTPKDIGVIAGEDAGEGIDQLTIPAVALLEKVSRALGLGDDEVAEVLEEAALDDESMVTIPVLGTITGGEEDRAVWDRVAEFVGSQQECEG